MPGPKRNAYARKLAVPFEVAGAINDPEAVLRLKALAADLLERAAALERDGES
jgi:hypothetical protein